MTILPEMSNPLPQHPLVRCKVYHRASHPADMGHVRESKWDSRKSRCPGWASNADIQQQLLAEAIVDPDAGNNMYGYPKRVWNAVAGWYFVGVATNEREPAYNCYPDVPATTVIDELRSRAERTLEDWRSTSAGVDTAPRKRP